nr:unnamed protein product [Callosobruchus chinensis]
MLVAKFRIFERPIALYPTQATLVVKATALHNWLKKNSASMYVNPGFVDRPQITINSINTTTTR